MADPAVLRAGIAANLAALQDSFQVSAYVLDNPTPPCVYIASGPIEYDAAMGRGHDVWVFTVFGLVGYVSDIGAQQTLDRLLTSSGDESVKELIEADRTLGGAAYSLGVKSTTGARVYVLTGQSPPAIGAEWTVEVMASGN